uniref:Uncharacterized protein n=1 Tax=Solanum tuberosum TaxID=4113 RepID=M1DYY4_SOLTU
MWYDSPWTTLGVIEEDPKLNLQDLKENQDCPKWSDLRKGSTSRRSIHATRMASVGQGYPNHVASTNHGGDSMVRDPIHGVLEEDPKLNPQDPKENEDCPKWSDIRKGSTPRKSIHALWMASVGQRTPNHAAATNHKGESTVRDPIHGAKDEWPLRGQVRRSRLGGALGE